MSELPKNAPWSGRPYVINDKELQVAIEEDFAQMCEMLAEKFAVSNETMFLHLHHQKKL